MPNPFFVNNGPFKISEILKFLNITNEKINEDLEISDIKDLFTSEKDNITFFHSKKYKDIAKSTKATFCITSDNLNLYFEKNLADILNNVVYKNLNTTLEADKIEIDLLTKNSNIYMNNKFEKIKIINKN